MTDNTIKKRLREIGHVFVAVEMIEDGKKVAYALKMHQSELRYLLAKAADMRLNKKLPLVKLPDGVTFAPQESKPA